VIELPDPRGREGERRVRWCKPSVGMGAVEFDPEAAMSVQRRSARSEGGGGASRHLAAHPLWIGG
jgi:hypothetical protein